MFDRRLDETICAPATAPGEAGLSVIRVSGESALRVAAQVLRPWPQDPLSHVVQYSFVVDAEGERVDEVLATYFKGPRSFTGEDTVEISSHGSPFVVESILSLLLQAGARLAKPGEFTFRAFMNGRIDLVQAEGVLDLIQARSRPAARGALNQVQGLLSQEYQDIEEGLLWCAAQTEAWIDFSEEDILPAESDQVGQRLRILGSRVFALKADLEAGQRLKAGLKALLAGVPNAGKSRLFNAILGEDRSIVTDVAGTTRDLVRGELSRRGVSLELSDSAGLRESADEVEQMGILRAQKLAQTADIVIGVLDGGKSRADIEKQFQQLSAELCGAATDLSKRDGLIWVVNKSDLLNQDERESLRQSLPVQLVFVSAASLEGVDGLREILLKRVDDWTRGAGQWAYKARHVECLGRLHVSIEAALEGNRRGMSPDLVGSEIQSALKTLYELLGREFHEQVIDRIFGEFCLGK
jgi:tRNA modification GTPase